ncbi:tyrosine-type recombinase/integrase [Amycolatopsis sp. NPDC005961]|uniref:tyrosine-type recombinase/integrase n=1 Tax=Amycolatopsis sp. NPDC005961 TaxID=3156720 RepID=UPI0033EE7255
MSRRANGEGTIYLRADGRYEAAATLPTSNGKRKRFRVYGKTRQEAHKKLTALIQEANQGIFRPEHAWKMAEYLDFWLDHERRRPLTRKRHESVVRLYIKPGLGRYRLQDLSVRLVQGFLDELYDDGRTPSTIHQIRKVLSAALTYAMRQEIVNRNVARLVELPRYRRPEAAHWTPDEIIQFLDVARDNPLYPAFVLLTLYGLRRGEVLGIRWRDVDFNRGVLRIRQQVQRIDGKLEQVELKTESSERDEPLLGTAREALERQRAAQAGARLATGADWQGIGTEDELVFTTRSGRPLESHNLGRSFVRICERHGLRKITLHGLRHSNATTQKDLQVHARDIQAILGHSDVRTTGIYEHVDLTSKRNALQKVEGRLFRDAHNRGGSRQISRQTADSDGSAGRGLREIFPKKIPTPSGVGTFFGGSSQTRTGDTRLFSKTQGPISDRLTSIKRIMQRHTHAWLLGSTAVSFAVNETVIYQHGATSASLPDVAELSTTGTVRRQER